MFTLNTLTDKVRQVLGGVQQQAPRALNEIGNFINKPITAQRGSSTPNFQQPIKLAQSIIKPIAQQPLAQSIPGMQGGSRLMSMSMPQVKQPTVGDAGKIALNIGRDLIQSTLYNPQTKQVLPQNLYTRLSNVPKPETIQDLKNPNSPYRQGMLNVDINTVIGAMTGGTGSKNPIKPYRIDIMPDDLAVAKNFAATVERLGAKGNKANLGQLGIDASRVVERYFGRKFALLPNTKIKQLFDYVLAKADNSRAGGQPGGIVVKPKGFTLPVGLSAQETEGLAQNALKTKNFTPLDVTALKQKQAAQKLPKIMVSTKKKDATFVPSGSKEPMTPEIKEAVKNDFIMDLEKAAKQSDVRNKVSLLDYARTPDRVLTKIGLKNEATELRAAHEAYKRDLKTEINKVSEWANRVPNPQSSQNIFRYLDGEPVDLTPDEAQVAKEIQGYLKDWAVKLKLPEDKRIASYITHIFDRDFITKEFDPDIAKLITDKVPRSVYDPFLQKRLGKRGYIEDVWRALDAYVKRATRKYNMDPALQKLSTASEGLDQSALSYVKRLGDRINMRPTELDNLLDNLIKQTPIGYKFGQRPTTVLTQKWRQMIYRGGLGLNIGSALRNVTQGANTYAKLGEKYTFKGYMDFVRKGTKELTDVGVLDDNLVQDRKFNAVKSMAEKMDNVLFAFFDMAEKINRGSAYYGAKAKALSQGMDEQQAIDYAKKIVRDTQFTFGAIDNPVALSSDLAKSLFQFQSFNLKQTEFLGSMAKNREWGGLIRWAGANIAILATVGKLFGMRPADMIPFSGFVTGESKISDTPLMQAATGITSTIFGDEQKREEGIEKLKKTGVLMIPAGAQIKKTIQGLDAVNKGYSESKSGRVQYPITQNTENTLRAGIFGKYTLPESREYYDKERSVLGEKQSETLKNSMDKTKTYLEIINKREADKKVDEVKAQMKESSSPIQEVGQKVLILQPNGDIKTIDKSFTPKIPELTGNTELDKKLISKYNGELTRKGNDILALYEAGKITQEDAEKQLNYLLAAKSKYAKAKKPKKPKTITIKKLSSRKPKSIRTIKIKIPKIPKPKKRLTFNKKRRTIRVKV